MTDREVILTYRIQKARETLNDAQRMINLDVMPRSIINRAYYAMFYAVLALITYSNIPIKTSRHTGIISIFDKDFIRTGKIEKRYSEMFHNAFDDRLEADYGDFIEPSQAEAIEHVKNAQKFLLMVEKIVNPSKSKSS